MTMTSDQASKAFALRMELTPAGIPWRACYTNGDDFVRFPTISETGIKYLISDHPGATETGVIVGGRVVPVASVEGARAVLAEANTPSAEATPEAVADNSPVVQISFKTPIESAIKSAPKASPAVEVRSAPAAAKCPRNGPGRVATSHAPPGAL